MLFEVDALMMGPAIGFAGNGRVVGNELVKAARKIITIAGVFRIHGFPLARE